MDPKTKLESASEDCEATEEKDGTPEEADELDATAVDVNEVDDVAPAELLLLEMNTDALSPVVEIDSVPSFFNGTNIISLVFLSLAADAEEDEGSGEPVDVVSPDCCCAFSVLAPLKPNGLESLGGRSRNAEPDVVVVLLFSEAT